MKKWIFIIAILMTSIFISIFIFKSNDSEKPMYTKINIEEYKKHLKNDDEFTIYVFKTSCPGCQQMKPVINKIIKENNIKLLAMNLEEDKNLDVSFLEEQKIPKTPTWVRYKNGKEVERLEGIQPENTLKKFMKNNQ
ncbi:thioredoxin family protein [Bacillus thuringiensis]|uniref:thioredoxin family protein n=1 Tax=Bacillus thuringiensis TaxID=1428 RepID=UPI000D0443C2|nr:thioredoxin family protein [Bacillus thuringiensis]MCU5606885.1 thioredoxin family protein [Bacillus cereus]MDR5041911.1 thioredoxin family protein [Bacillus thuringiensis]